MPKGDKEILKADIDDGFTKISNLILEALAIAKLTGIQKGLCLFLFRRTYSWGKKEDEISLREFAAGVDSSKTYVSEQLKKLIELKILLKPNDPSGKVPTYSFNTRVQEWQKGSVDTERLRGNDTEGLYRCRTVGFRGCRTLQVASAPVDTGPEHPPKEILKKYKESNNNSSTEDQPKDPLIDPDQKEVLRYFSDNFVAVSSPLHTQKLCAWLDNGTSPCMIKYAIEKAVLANVRRFDYLEAILKNLWDRGARTAKDCEALEEEYKKTKGGKAGGKSGEKHTQGDPRGDPAGKYREFVK